jgi:hypothetical protein
MHILNVQVASRCLLVHDIGLENIVAALPHLLGAPSVIAVVKRSLSGILLLSLPEPWLVSPSPLLCHLIIITAHSK